MVSVIVPVYNQRNELSACIESLCGQTFRDLEILLIDDGSTDDSAAVCRSYAAADPRIRCITRPNGGVSAARNTGIRAAAGEYLLFVDGDDRVEPELVERLYSAAVQTASTVTLCGYNEFGGQRCKSVSYAPKLCQNRWEVARFVAAHYLQSAVSTPWAKLFRKADFSAWFDESMSFAEDSLFNIQVFRQTDRLCVLPDCLYDYRTPRAGSLTGSYRPDYFDGMKKLYIETMDYFSEMRTAEPPVDETKAAYKLYRYAAAFLVRQWMDPVYRQDARSDTARITADPVLRDALTRMRGGTVPERAVRFLMQRRWNGLLCLVARLRAWYKLYR